MKEKIKAKEGYILTNGETYGAIIYLANEQKPQDFWEISLAEYEEILLKLELEALKEV